MQFIFVCLVALFLSLPSFAVVEESVAETASTTTTGLGKHELVLGATDGALSFSESNFNLGLSFGYNARLAPLLQIGAFPSISFRNSSNGYSSFNVIALGLAVGPTLNFSRKIESAFFITAKVGAAVLRTLVSNVGDRTFLWGNADLGKRFLLTESLTYSPSIGVEKYQHGTVYFHVKLINFSALL